MASSHLAALVSLLIPCLLALLLLRLAAVLDPDPDTAVPRIKAAAPLPLRFRHDGAFKILQVRASRPGPAHPRAHSLARACFPSAPPRVRLGSLRPDPAL
jgi:hypothetical protein